MPEIREFMKQFYILDDWVRQFLIVGEEEALLIDTGVEESHVAEAVRQITSLPVRVVLTHGDHDHAGGLGAFGSAGKHRPAGPGTRPAAAWGFHSEGGHDLYVRPQTEPGAVSGEPAGAAASGGGDPADPAQPRGVSH